MINSISIQGRLTADPQVKHTDNEIVVCNFSIAHERSYIKDEKVTDFFDCVAWRAKAEFLQRNFSKGDMIAITGKLFTETFTDKNGSSRKAVKILVTEIAFSGGSKAIKDKTVSTTPKGLEGLKVPDDLLDINAEDLPF